MSRSTTALKRLGVPGLAAVTMVAGLPLFLGTALANHVGTPTFTPVDGTGSSAAAGSCQAYYVDLPPTGTTSTVGETVNVILTDALAATPSTPSTSDVDFCTLPTTDATGKVVTPQAGTSISSEGPKTGGGSVDQREFTTTAAGTTGTAASTGRAVVGVTRNQPGGPINIQAYYDANNNNAFNAGEPTNNQTLTFTAGGPAGSNENQNAAEYVEVVESKTDPKTKNADVDTALKTETRTYRVFVGNGDATDGTLGGPTVPATAPAAPTPGGDAAAGDQLNGVTVSYVVNSNSGTTGATRAPATFGVTDNDGIATATITFPTRGESGNTTDTVTFYVNQTDGSSANIEAAEPGDNLVVTVQDNANQQNRSIVLSPKSASKNVPAAPGALTQNYTAVIDDSRSTGADTTTTGTLVTFTVSGGDGDEFVTVTPAAAQTSGKQSDCTSQPNVSADPNDSQCDVTVTDPSPKVGQVLTLTGTIRGTTVSDTATLTERNDPTNARNIDLTPNAATTAPNTARTFTATVTDSLGNGVSDVRVQFTETGAGAFRNGSSSVNVFTDAAGKATVEVIALPGETGTQQVTAEITGFDSDRNGGINGAAEQRGAGANDDQCESVTGAGQQPNGTAVPSSQTAGNCSDTSTNTFAEPQSPSPSPSATSTATASPSATPTATTSPSAPPATNSPSPSGPPAVPCTVTPRIALERDTITATGSSGITVTGTPNSIVEVQAYSRPSTTFRVVRRIELGADGRATDRIVPPTNTRLYAQQVGCDAGPQIVLNVRTALSLNVERLGTRTYRFSGDSLPARPGGLIISLYRVTNDGRQVLTSQVRADSRTGEWTLDRRFTGTGRFGFVVRTGQDLQNAPGSSNVRSLLVF